MHLYHFGTYERDHFRLLMGRHATRENQIDKMLRAHLFIDLHTIFKQAVRAGVEEYSLKQLEVFHDFKRVTSLDESRVAMRMIEHWLELEKSGELRTQDKAAMEGYNEDDCRSTASLRNWLEARRREVVENGMEIPRPAQVDGEPKKKQNEHEQEVAKVAGQLTLDIPSEPAKLTNEQTARRTLALLLDWHQREIRVGYAEGYRFAEFDDDRLLDERVGLAGLKHEKRISNERGCPVDRYTFEPQKTNIRREKELYLDTEKFGEVVEIDHVNGTVDIKKTKKSADMHPPGVYMWDRPYSVNEQQDALLRIGRWVAGNHADAHGPYRAARDLLLRREPRGIGNTPMVASYPENTEERANRLAGALDNSVLAIQGPPGSGKTHLAARMICKLAKEGKKIGVCALSHKVIRHLLDTVVVQADDPSDARCMQRSDYDEEAPNIAMAPDNEPALDALKSGEANVVGGTSYLWAPEASFEVLDYLFIDEAGQMSLADVMAVAQAAKNLVLVGDPQQLERPIKANHPAETDESALEHLLGEDKTISDEKGMFLPGTRRLHPKICDFTSPVFYDGRLESEQVARNRSLAGHPWLNAAGLWFVPVDHEGNGNSSPEEVEVVAQIAASLMAPGVERFYSIGNSEPVAWENILIVAPYNAQVSDLKTRLPNARVGTVDKLQGQEASIVIYSLTSSSPGEVPRGMEFFFSLNRFNVATSRAETTVIVVGNPRLFEPECKTPRQMQLANAFCWYLEMAKTHRID
jgi:AAA domain/RNase_H superfamily